MGALLDPFFDEFDLCGLKRFLGVVAFLKRHFVIEVIGGDATEELGLFRLSRERRRSGRIFFSENVLAVMSEMSPSALTPPWHLVHLLMKMGRMWVLKEIFSSAGRGAARRKIRRM